MPATRFTFIKQEAIITKKIILPILAALLLFTGCGAEKPVEKAPRPVAPPTVIFATEQPSPTPEPTQKFAIDCPYSSLGFEGRDVNAQHYRRSYSTTEAELISAVWNIISSEEREEVSDYQSWEDMMYLTFLGRTTERVKLQPDDYCELVDSGKKYALAPGSYSAISELLTEYTTENYSFTIDENFLSVMTCAVEDIVFIYDSYPISVMPRDIGDFTESWVLFPSELQDGAYTGRCVDIQNIYTNDCYGPVEVSVYFDMGLILVTCDGITEAFSTDRNTLDSIDRLLESLENG